MERKAILVGDPPSGGGAVMPGGLTQATVRGVPYATIGGAVKCSACRSIGTIAKAGGPYRVQMYGFEIALENDIVLCKCPVAPTLIAKAISSGPPNVTVDDRVESLGAVPSINNGVVDAMAEHEEVAANPNDFVQYFEFVSTDGHPVNLSYAVHSPDGVMHEGVLEKDGRTAPFPVTKPIKLIAWSKQ